MARRIKRNRNDKSPDAPILHENHKRPITRREFLGAGLISGGAMVMAPSLLSFLPTRAHALVTDERVCGIGANASGLAFICIDLGGGANIAGSNVMVGGPTGQSAFLSQAAYGRMGLPPGLAPTLANEATTIDRSLGLAFHVDSAFLRGIKSKTTVGTRVGINGAIIPARSDNDTSTNPHNPMYGIAKAGANGSLLTLIGSSNSDSGGRSVAPVEMIDPSIRPTQIARPSDASSLVDTGDLGTLMPDSGEAGKVMEAIEGISADRIANRADALSTDPLDPLDPNSFSVQDLVHCGYLKTTDTVKNFSGDAGFDPLADPNIVDSATDGRTPATSSNADPTVSDLADGDSIFTADEVANDAMKRKTASVMKLVIGGKAGAGTIEQGGYDYHTGTRAPGESRDFRAGQCMGACLEYAARRATPLMLYVFSDGSVFSDGNVTDGADGDARSKPNWTGDDSSTAASFFLYYDPNVVPTARNNQIGYFRPNGSVETTNTTPGANNVNALVDMVILNYMSLSSTVNLSDFPTLFPTNRLGIRQASDTNLPFVQAMIGLEPQ